MPDDDTQSCEGNNNSNPLHELLNLTSYAVIIPIVQLKKKKKSF